MGKILKVKDIAKQYGVPAKSVIEELAGQGIEANDAENSVIPDDMIELVEMYFADLYDQDSEPAAAARQETGQKRRQETAGRAQGRARRRPRQRQSAQGRTAAAGRSLIRTCRRAESHAACADHRQGAGRSGRQEAE